jgi:hypothetical protein
MLIDDMSVGTAEVGAVDADGVLSEEGDPGAPESCGTGEPVGVPTNANVEDVGPISGVLGSVGAGEAGMSDFPGTI